MTNNRVDQPVKPFLLHFAQRLPSTPPVQATPEGAGTPSVRRSETRFTKVVSETTDDA
jgi:hypothetical protein